jgi:hypothetical protein
MLDELGRRQGVLNEATAALEIVRIFGGDFCSVAPDGTFTIGRPVLDAFARACILGDKEVVWNDVEHAWRFSESRANPYR